MAKVLVLGATGFVGTHVAKALQEYKEIEMVLGYRDHSKLDKALKSEAHRIGDIRDETYVQGLFEGIDIVINLASWTALYAQEENSKQLFLEPTLALIKRAKESGVKKYMNLSTVSAACMDKAKDANSLGCFRSFWPHLNSVIHIEDYLRRIANREFQVINLRCGLFVGEHYSLGLLPILLPRLKTHLVPLVKGGRTSMPLIDGKDIAQAFVKGVLYQGTLPHDFEGFNILGKEIPLVKEVLEYLHAKHRFPYPHFSVPFSLAYWFAGLMEKIAFFLPHDPLIVRSIVHLLEETGADNEKARSLLGYEPMYAWQDSIDRQIQEMQVRNEGNMQMHKGI